ncbi:MAG: HGGxSTG domain-containing protein [Alphaproteobacteria bacterium]|nr:HGGxSTG domain-containing protein [Alphaproteobacteria bacterium]
MEAGKATRFGPGWPGTRCLAKTRRGTLCQNPAIGGRTRCKLHGGKSTGPKSIEGKARVVAANTKHGLRSRAHAARIREINAELRQLTCELKLAGLIS